MTDRLAEFTAFRQRMNERILSADNQVVRRFFALDTQTYKAGALDVKTKEMLGLVASLVLRCDDCISYHVAQCKAAGVDRDALFEVFSVGLLRGSCLKADGAGVGVRLPGPAVGIKDLRSGRPTPDALVLFLQRCIQLYAGVKTSCALSR